jgi:hypothetical protein
MPMITCLLKLNYVIIGLRTASYQRDVEVADLDNNGAEMPIAKIH